MTGAWRTTPDAAGGPAVDVVMPAYNAARWIGEALDSALGQRRVKPRIVVVDDGSTDRTCEIVAARAPQVTLIRQASRQGPGAARNLGVARGSAPYLAFLDADDVWAPDFLGRQTALLEAQPELALAFTDHYQFQDGGPVVVASFLGEHGEFQRIPRRKAGEPDAFVFDRPIGGDLVDGMFVWIGAACVRRAAFEAIGAFDPMLIHAQDHDLWLRLCRSGRAGVILAPLVGRRLYAESHSSNDLAWLEAELRITDNIEKAPDRYPPAAARLVARRWAICLSAGRVAESSGQTERARDYYLRSWRLGGGPKPLMLALLTRLPGPVRGLVKGTWRRLAGVAEKQP